MNKQNNKKLKFNWRLTEKYSRSSGLWKSDVKKIEIYGLSKYSDIAAYAFYQTGLNGPNTVFVTFCLSIWPSTMYHLRKHFKGKNAWLKARTWCNWLLNNPPDYCEIHSKKEV